MYCSKDCDCSLCRELRGYKPSTKAPPKRAAPRPPSTATSLFGRFNENFILRRRQAVSSFKTFQPQSLKCSEMYQQRNTNNNNNKNNAKSNDNIANDTINEKQHLTPAAAAAPTPAAVKPSHKVVIYFGDSIAHRGRQQPPQPQPQPQKISQSLHNVSLDDKNVDTCNSANDAGPTAAAATTPPTPPTTTPTRQLLLNELTQKQKQLLKQYHQQKNHRQQQQQHPANNCNAVTTTQIAPTPDAISSAGSKPLAISSPHVKSLLIAPDAIAETSTTDESGELGEPGPTGSSTTTTDLPPYIESITNGVINIRIDGNYRHASALVKTVAEPTRAFVRNDIDDNDNDEADAPDDASGDERTDGNTGGGPEAAPLANTNEDSAESQYESCDWSFVQEWRRTRPTGNMRNGEMPIFGSPQQSGGGGGIGLEPSAGGPSHNGIMGPSSGRIQSPAVATPAMRISKEVAHRPPIVGQSVGPTMNSPSSNANTSASASTTVTPIVINSSNTSHFESYQCGGGGQLPQQQKAANSSSFASSHNISSKPMPHRSIAGPAHLTVLSTPVKSQPPMISSNLTPASGGPGMAKGNNGAPKTTHQSEKSPHQANLRHHNLSGASSLGIPTDAAGFPHSGNVQSPGSKSTNATVISSGSSSGNPNMHHQNMSAGGPKPSISTRTHHHEFRSFQRVHDCHSSSDENRSSGHASMSDTGGHGSSSPGGGVTLGPVPEDRLAAGVTNRSTRSRASTNHSRPRHRATPAKAPWGGNGLEDIKLAIQQLTMRSQTSTSTYSSLSAGSESSEPARRLGRYSSLETVNTNVTSADEFVWVDSHNRLVELQNPPWSQHCIMRVIRNGRCKEQADRVTLETIPRLGYLLQRALVRIAREVQRLSASLGLCSKQEVAGAFKIVLCPALADSCIKACLRAAAMFAVPGDSALKQSKSSRAGLQLPVGRFHRWMADARLGKFIHEYAAVYLCAGMENLLEEILLQSFPADASNQLTVAALEVSIAGSSDMWGLLQPFAHLNAGRVASGALTMPRWASQSSLGSNSHASGGGGKAANLSLEPCLLTTCVGSISELRELAMRAQQKFQHTSLSNAALSTLFYFMRCSQLEHSEAVQPGGHQGASNASQGGSSQNVQELCYERAYVVLPPLVEWLRVATAHAEYRNALMIDKDDVMQAARLLLPGVDCPMRPIGHDEELPTKKTHFSGFSNGAATSTAASASSISEDTTELGKRATITLAFKLMLTGRAELLSQASNLLAPTTRYDTLNHAGMTALMIASIRNDEVAIQALLDAGCDPNVEVPAIGQSNCPAIHPDTQHWTAVTFAASRANYVALRMLLERGGKVEGGARLSEDKTTLTPLQVACGSGNIEVVALLLAHGANPFLSTQQRDTMCFAGSAQRGCYCAISVAAAHGQRACLRKLLSHPMSPGNRDVLSLEEMLAEGDVGASRPPPATPGTSTSVMGNTGGDLASPAVTLSKAQIKSLQEAMYHSAENNNLDITIELRTLGVPWTLHCWMHALAAANELRLDAVIDQLLQDFLQVCPDDYSAQFVSECLPLLFNIFRYSKNEGTTLLLADIFATCFGWETIKPIKEAMLQPVSSSRIDPKFVNNPELSDVTFRVEGKIFYGHKIVLVTASPRFQNMLSSKLSEGNTPTVQINDIRYHIFQLVMQYLYSGGCGSLEVQHCDVLELMAAASFFQLEGLLRYTESRCSEMIDIDNVVAMYIHAKVYNANKLLEYCQGFLLQNMVALLTYDDSVKRLLFAKKIPNHDVLSGLLQTLQQRIKQRKPNGVGNFRQQLSSPPACLNGATAGVGSGAVLGSPSASGTGGGVGSPPGGAGSLSAIKK